MPEAHVRLLIRGLLGPATLAVFTLIGPAGATGGSAADYARAAGMRDRVRGTVLNERLEPVWVGDHSLVFRHGTAPGRWRFIEVDLRTGERTDAFDHDSIARQLGDALPDADPAAIPADQVPLTLHATDGGRLIGTLPAGLAFEVDRQQSLVRRLDEFVGADDPRALPQVRARRSRDDGAETEVRFINGSTVPLRLIWLDRGGAPRAYGTIAPGAERRQHTYAGHVWRLEAEDDRVLGIFRARRTPAIASVTDESSPLEAREHEVSEPTTGLETFVRDHDLHVRDRATGEVTRLTDDGTAGDHYTNRVIWSPDRSNLVVIRTTPAQSHPVHLIDTAPDDQVQPRLITHDYLKPGDEIAHPRPVLIDLGTGAVTPIDDALFPVPWSITRVTWERDGRGFHFLYNERGHRLMRLLHVDAGTGAVRAVIDEAPETFFDYAGKLHLTLLPEPGEAIWMSERSGWNHLYLVDLETGSVLNSITQGPWLVRAVDEIDRDARTIRFRAMGVFPGQDPYHVHHGRVRFDGTGLTWLTEADGTHRIDFSPSGEHYLDTWSRVDLPPVHEVRRTSDGALVAELARADWGALLATGWRPPERFVAKGRDGLTDIHGIIFTPVTFDPSETYPVIENIYAGPTGHFVPKSFAAWHGSREIAELGFVVVRIDGMGTNWRSKAFHDVAWKNLGDSGLSDRIAWMRAAAADRPWVDLERVGIYGGSAGGQSALRAMLAHGDFYRAAVADCGCHDNRMDKIWWNELWMSWPIGEHYAEQSNVTQAHRLEGPLLLIVGELDHNVDPASTMQVVDALIAADKDFDLVIMTGAGHGAAETPYGKRRRKDFFVHHLLGVEPRWTPE